MFLLSSVYFSESVVIISLNRIKRLVCIMNMH